MEIDELITVKEILLIILDSRNAISYLNGSFNSKLDFDFADIIDVYCSVLSFTCQNSIYINNEYNNKLCMNVNGTINTYFFQYGNYNAQTFMNAFTTLNQISFNSITNTFTLNNNAPFTILNTSTIYEIMGFAKNTNNSSINNSLTLHFTCNFNGLVNINIVLDDVVTENRDSFTGSISSIIQNIPFDTNSTVIKFVKRNDFCIPVKINSINDFSISLINDSGQYINLNNQHFNLTLEFTILKDVARFKMNFQNVIKNV